MKPADIEKERRSMLKFYAPAGFLLGISVYYFYVVQSWGINHPGVIAGTLLAAILIVIGIIFGVYRRNHPFSKDDVNKGHKAYTYLWPIVGVVLILFLIDLFTLNVRKSLTESPFWIALFSIIMAGGSILAGWAAYVRIGLFQRTK